MYLSFCYFVGFCNIIFLNLPFCFFQCIRVNLGQGIKTVPSVEGRPRSWPKAAEPDNWTFIEGSTSLEVPATPPLGHLNRSLTHLKFGKVCPCVSGLEIQATGPFGVPSFFLWV